MNQNEKKPSTNAGKRIVYGGWTVQFMKIYAISNKNVAH